MHFDQYPSDQFCPSQYQVLFFRLKTHIIDNLAWKISPQKIQNMSTQMGYKLKPNKSIDELQSLRSNKYMQLSDYLEYCYYLITKFQNQSMKTLDQKFLNELIYEKSVLSQYRPCLIYQHISQTFASLIEAFNDKDQILMQKEVEQIKQSIQSFWRRDDLPEYKNYQCIFEDQLDQSNTDKLTRQKFFDTFSIVVNNYIDPSRGTKFNPGAFPDKSKRNIQKKNQKQTQLKKRLQSRVNPLLQKILQKIPAQKQLEASQYDEQRDFILSYGIGLYK